MSPLPEPSKNPFAAEGDVIPAGPCTFVIFGAAGDLTKRKLVPALYHLAITNYLAKDFAVIGFARTEMSEADFRKKLTEDVTQYGGGQLNEAIWTWFLDRIYYVHGNFDDPQAYGTLKETMAQVEKKHATKGNVLFYLATLPSYFAPIVDQLDKAGLNKQNGQWRRVIIEKPFGSDLASAKDLTRQITKTLEEDQIYRIDHYLGKETVQNLLALRFGNVAYEPIWNQRYIDHVAITAAEELGVEQRGPFYESAGALRDMVPNHLLQLLALTAMEPPASLDAEAIRNEKSKVLRSVHVMTPEEVLQNCVRGQYGPGTIDGKPVKEYRAEDRVSPTSNVETFLALKLQVDNWRWGQVPFYLRTGKRLASRVTEIVIQFKNPPFRLFKQAGAKQMSPNSLVMGIQPVEGIKFSFQAKAPGPGFHLGDVAMDFNYCDRFGCEPNTGYETLLYDCMIGDQTQYQRTDMLEAGWSVVQPILDVWKSLPARDFPNYASGSEGPRAAFDLMAKDGRAWKPLT